MKKILFVFFTTLAALVFFLSSSHATVIFSDDFESGLSNWTGKDISGGLHNGVIVNDPLDTDYALTFNNTNSAGDVFTTGLGFSAGHYSLTFDFLGTSGDSDSGGYLGISSELPGSHTWLISTGSGGGESLLIDDGAWHTYTIEFDAWYSFHLMLEDFAWAASNTPGDAFFDNISLSTSPVPEPATMVLFGLGLLGLAGVNRKKI